MCADTLRAEDSRWLQQAAAGSTHKSSSARSTTTTAMVEEVPSAPPDFHMQCATEENVLPRKQQQQELQQQQQQPESIPSATEIETLRASLEAARGTLCMAESADFQTETFDFLKRDVQQKEIQLAKMIGALQSQEAPPALRKKVAAHNETLQNAQALKLRLMGLMDSTDANILHIQGEVETVTKELKEAEEREAQPKGEGFYGGDFQCF